MIDPKDDRDPHGQHRPAVGARAGSDGRPRPGVAAAGDDPWSGLYDGNGGGRWADQPLGGFGSTGGDHGEELVAGYDGTGAGGEELLVAGWRVRLAEWDPALVARAEQRAAAWLTRQGWQVARNGDAHGGEAQGGDAHSGGVQGGDAHGGDGQGSGARVGEARVGDAHNDDTHNCDTHGGNAQGSDAHSGAAQGGVHSGAGQGCGPHSCGGQGGAAHGGDARGGDVHGRDAQAGYVDDRGAAGGAAVAGGCGQEADPAAGPGQDAGDEVDSAGGGFQSEDGDGLPVGWLSSADEDLDRLLHNAEAAVDQLVGFDAEYVSREGLACHAVAMQRLVNKTHAAQVAAVGAVDRRQVFADDGAVTCSSWLQARTLQNYGQVKQLVAAAKRLCDFPALDEVFTSGRVSLAHVTQVTTAAVPRRAEAMAANDAVFADLAVKATPKDVGVTVKQVRDLTDPDGTEDTEDLRDTGPDERRGLSMWETIDRLWEIRGTLDAVQAEAVKTLLDAFEQPDPADTPEDQKRSPEQRRADALAAAATAALNAGISPTVQGVKPHLLVMVDLQTLLGRADLASFDLQARFTGHISLEQLLRVAPDCTFTPVLTHGRYRAVSVGREQRTLPGWLRAVLEALHRQCRGPDCDRPVAWSEAHHVTAWAHGGHTDLNQTIPVCKAHHDLVTNGYWNVAYDTATGQVEWTSTATGRTHRTRPPPHGLPPPDMTLTQPGHHAGLG